MNIFDWKGSFAGCVTFSPRNPGQAPSQSTSGLSRFLKPMYNISKAILACALLTAGIYCMGEDSSVLSLLSWTPINLPILENMLSVWGSRYKTFWEMAKTSKFSRIWGKSPKFGRIPQKLLTICRNPSILIYNIAILRRQYWNTKLALKVKTSTKRWRETYDPWVEKQKCWIVSAAK